MVQHKLTARTAAVKQRRRSEQNDRPYLVTRPMNRFFSRAAATVHSRLKYGRQLHWRQFIDSTSLTSRDQRFLSTASSTGGGSTSDTPFLLRATQWYLKCLDLRPLMTKSITAAGIYAAADLTSQVPSQAAVCPVIHPSTLSIQPLSVPR